MSFHMTYEDPSYYEDTDYELRVAMLEAEGMTRSDAQAVVDAELLQEELINE